MSEIRTLIDNWQELDDARLAANRVAKDATTKAEQAKQQLIAALESDNLTGAGGSHWCRCGRGGRFCRRLTGKHKEQKIEEFETNGPRLNPFGHPLVLRACFG